MQQSILSEKNYLTYLSGSIFSTQGLWVQRMTLGWMLWQITHSESLLGLLAFFLFTPSIIFGPVFGVLVDRVDRQKAAINVSLILGVISFLLAITTYYSLINDIILLLYALVIGVANSAYQSIRLSFVPELVSKENMPKAIAINAIIYNSSRFIGPIIAGLLINSFNNATSLFFVAFCYVPLLIVLMKLRISPKQPSNSSFTFFEDISAGVNYAFKSALISKLLILITISAVLGRGFLEILPAAADVLFQGDVNTLASLNSAAGAGAILAGLILSKLQSKQLIVALYISTILSGVTIFAFHFMTSITQGLVLITCLSFFATVCGVCTQSLIQVSVHSDFRGRIMSLWGAINLGGAAIGGITFGFLTEFAGYDFSFIILGTLCIIISLLTCRRLSL